MEYEITVSIGHLEGKTRFKTTNELYFATHLGYLIAMLIGENFEDLKKIEIRKVEEE